MKTNVNLERFAINFHESFNELLVEIKKEGLSPAPVNEAFHLLSMSMGALIHDISPDEKTVDAICIDLVKEIKETVHTLEGIKKRELKGNA